MRCPFCSEDDDKVLDSRPSEENSVIRRRRECNRCGDRFTTFERVESQQLFVIKKDGTRQPFDRAKITRGLIKACEKTAISKDEYEAVVDRVESKLRRDFSQEVQASLIGELVMEQLVGMDPVAFVRFASVYKEFRSIDEFRNELERFRGKD